MSELLSYLQSPESVYTMESGILHNMRDFQPGKQVTFTYDFHHDDYSALLARYKLAETAQNGSEFERARRLMNTYAPRLIHKGDYDNHIAQNALDLLAYALDNPAQGINCRAKAQILNEMCLALGIYARKLWLMPLSTYDNECHVVNEIWDTTLNKWVMLDVTSNLYWVDEKGTPLSVLEIRECLASQRFCTPVGPEDDLTQLKQVLEKNYDVFLYIAKNMVWLMYCTTYSIGESAQCTCILLPRHMDAKGNKVLVDESAITAPPASSAQTRGA